jgi:hypothetical protein
MNVKKVTRSVANSLTLVLNRYERSAACSCHFTLLEIATASFEYKAGCAPGTVYTSWRRKISLAPALDRTPDHPVLSLAYTS